MYREVLEPSIACCLLGDKYDETCTYVLYSFRDMFVVGVINSAGEQIDEIKLEQEAYINEEEETCKTQAESLQEDLSNDKVPLSLKVIQAVMWVGIILVIIAAIAGIFLLR